MKSQSCLYYLLIQFLAEDDMEGGLFHEVLQEPGLREAPSSCRQVAYSSWIWISSREMREEREWGTHESLLWDRSGSVTWSPWVQVRLNSHNSIPWETARIPDGPADHLHHSPPSRWYEAQLVQGRLHTFVYTKANNDEGSKRNDLVIRALVKLAEIIETRA